MVDSLQQKLKIEVPDSLKKLVPADADILPDVKVPELDIDPLQKVGEITEVEELEPLKEIQNIGDVKKLEELKEISEIEKVEAIADQAQTAENEVKKAWY